MNNFKFPAPFRDRITYIIQNAAIPNNGITAFLRSTYFDSQSLLIARTDKLSEWLCYIAKYP